MTDATIRDGRELKCPDCGTWHPLERPVSEAARTHESAQRMRYFTCRGVRYFAGAIGTSGQYPTRPRPS